ncbi:MAG TPA: hypothetical protein VN025_09580 [Candidatus Dormibacteraeota bacterium]|jgi:hypothetical protein|nr:hypothetical protein [Candidatus Dormibacteraeota bacterium]
MPTNVNYIIAAGAVSLGIVVGWMAYHTFKRQERLDAKVMGSIISVIAGASVIGIFQKIAGKSSDLPQELYLYPVGLLIGVVVTAIVKFVGQVGKEEPGSKLESPKLVATNTPKITMVDVLASDSVTPGLAYPVKCYTTFRNDSEAAVEVKLSEYKHAAVDMKKFVPDVLQIKFRDWLPADHGVDRVGVYPGQLFRAWIGVNEKNFQAQSVNNLRGKIGTIVLLINNSPQSFDL